MSGRRGNPRFAVTTPWEGTMRVLRDVVVNRTATQELTAVSNISGVVGEEMSLALLGAGADLGLRVKVLESRPLIVDGSLRHKLTLALVGNGNGDLSGLPPDVSFRVPSDSAAAGTN